MSVLRCETRAHPSWALSRLFGEYRYPAQAKKLESSVVEGWRTCAVGCIALWNKQDHSLPSSGQNHSISILKVESPRLVIHGLPFCSLESLVDPHTILVMKVTVPTYADPIQFKTLDRKLARHILQIIRGSDIGAVIQKPISWLDLRLDVNAFGPKALST